MKSPKPKSLIKLALLFLAGSLLTFSLAPFKLWPLSLIGLCAFLLLNRSSNAKAMLSDSFVFSAGLFLSGSYWVYVSMNTYGGASPVLASIMTLGFCLGIAALLCPFMCFFQKYFTGNGLSYTLGFAALWLLHEWLRSWFLTGFPWLYLGYSQTESILASYAPITSVYGISFILAFTAASISFCIINKKAHASLFVVAACWLLALPLAQLSFTENKSDKPISVALLQPNVDLNEKWQAHMRQPIINDLVQTTSALDEKLIIWPETAIVAQYPAAAKITERIGRLASNKQQAIITGIPSLWRDDERNNSRYRYHNSMLGLGQATGIYHKQKLVPFGEYVPLEKALRGLIDFFNLPMSQFSKGPGEQAPFKAFDLTLWAYICYEVVYPEFVAQSAHEADVLITVSNDAWFGESIGPLQHLQMAQMRALENGRYMLRATNNGVTAIIGPNGKILAQIPQFEKGVLKGEVYARKGLTPVAQYGTLAPIIFSILAVLALLFLPKRKDPDEPNS